MSRRKTERKSANNLLPICLGGDKDMGLQKKVCRIGSGEKNEDEMEEYGMGEDGMKEGDMDKMAWKKTGYLAMVLCGILAVTAAILWKESFSNRAAGILVGLGSMSAALGIVRFCICRYEEKYPSQKRKSEIEYNDERNLEIRLRAQAAAGQALQWALIGLAWIVIFLDGSLWVTLGAIGAFCGKLILEMLLTAYYRKQM
jgi:hypothetical protein